MRPAMSLTNLVDHVACMNSDVRWMEGQDDVIFWYSGDNKFFGDAVFDAIVMNPDFVITDFGMNDGAMNSVIFSQPS
jgi:hypothetical protein